MARLRNQKWMVKKLHNFFKDTNYTNPDSRRMRLGNIAKDAIPDNDFSSYIASVMTVKDKTTSFFRPEYFKSEKYQLHRANMNNRLFISCIEDGYIEPVMENISFGHDVGATVRRGIRVSSKGGDLIHPIGYTSIALEKYKPLVLLLTGAFGMALLSGIVWVVTHIVGYIRPTGL